MNQEHGLGQVYGWHTDYYDDVSLSEMQPWQQQSCVGAHLLLLIQRRNQQRDVAIEPRRVHDGRARLAYADMTLVSHCHRVIKCLLLGIRSDSLAASVTTYWLMNQAV